MFNDTLANTKSYSKNTSFKFKKKLKRQQNSIFKKPFMIRIGVRSIRI